MGSWVRVTTARARVGPQLLQRLVRPVGADRDVGEAGIAGERAARIDHRDVVTGEARHRHQALGDVHRADHDQAQRRIEDLDEDAAVLGLDRRALVASLRRPGALEQGRGDRPAEHRLAGDHQSLVALVEPAQMGGRLLRGAGLEQALQECALQRRGLAGFGA